MHRCLYGLIFILYLQDQQILVYYFSFTTKQCWRESAHIYLSLVLPVKMTGKNLAYFPTPNCLPNSCILFESRRIKASHNRQKSRLNPSSNVLQFPWSSRTFHPKVIFKKIKRSRIIIWKQ